MKKFRLRPAPDGLWGLQLDKGRGKPPIYFVMGRDPGRVIDKGIARFASKRDEPPPHLRPQYPEH